MRKDTQPTLDLVVYPVLTLPHEITSEIFLQCLTSQTDSKYKEHPHPSRAPLLLLQVCRTWRSIAISTPRLWAYLHVDCVKISYDFRAKLPKRIETWFGRAGSCPLSFSVGGWEGGLDGAILSKVFARHGPRLTSLDLRLERDLIDAAARVSFPLLEKLTIDILGDVSGEEPEALTEVFQDTPRLAELAIGEFTRLRPELLSLPYAQLSKLTCCKDCMIEGDDFIDLLRAASSLVEVSATLDSYGVIADQVTTHDHLQTLRLDSCNSRDIKVLSCLRLPALRKLSLSFYSRSFIPTDWISTLSALECAEFREPKVDSLSAFFLKLDHSTFLPHLKSLTFVDCEIEFDETVLQALSSRCASESIGGEGAPLLTFRQIWSAAEFATASLEESTADALRDLVAKGMKIHVGPPGRNCI
ncbi:hypothetical protein C8R43DRAFT_969577 [Mycena crocata]|nr:hypothetical protein C8R43DRAFT_969577 [Mycena crocata]